MEEIKGFLKNLASSFVGQAAVSTFFLAQLLFAYYGHQKKKYPSYNTSPIPNISISCIQIIRKQGLGQLPQSLLAWSREYKNDIGDMKIFTLNIPVTSYFRNPHVVMADSNVVRRVMLDKSSYKPKRMYNLTKGIHDPNVENFFMANGHRWSHARKSMSAAFSSIHIKRMTNVTNEKVQDFMKHLDELQDNDTCKEDGDNDDSASEGGSFDVAEEMVSLTLSIICDAAFEYQMDEEEQREFLTNLQLALKENRKRLIPLRARFGAFIPTVRRARAAAMSVREVGQKVLDNYRDNIMDNNPIKGTVIDCIVSDSSYQNDEERVADILMILVAGHDTTGYSLAWALIELARNRQEQDRLRDDLLSLANVDDERINGKQNYKGRVNSRTLQCFIKESMRLNTVAPLAGFRCMSEDLIIDVERGTTNRDRNDVSNSDGESSNSVTTATGTNENTATSRMMVIKKHTMLIFASNLLLRDPKYFPDPNSLP